MATYLITGTSRGIGLELTTQLLSEPVSKVALIIAVTRSPSPAVSSLISQHPNRVINLLIPDLTSESVVRAAVQELQEKHNISAIDILINNAGIMPYHPEGPKTMSGDALREVLNTNVVAVHVVTATLIPLLEAGQGKKVFTISSMLGSMKIAANFHKDVPAHGYKVSKAAVNMLMLQWALEYQEKGFTFLAIAPGWVKTELGTDYADLTVQEAVQSVLDIVHSATPEQNGKHLNIKVEGWNGQVPGKTVYDGGEMPW